VLAPNDVKEQLSLAYVHAVAARAGFAMERTAVDRDSIDVQIRARGRLTHTATIHSAYLDVQLKAHVLDPVPDDKFYFDLPIKNYRDLTRRCTTPRILVVFVMPEADADWVTCSEDALVLKRSAYWVSLLGHPPSENAATQRVWLSRSQVFDPENLRRLLIMVGEEQAIP
jgi:hypothetical protein